jgi:hypothetical protein
MCNKYGMAYLLKNGNIGIYLNDQTSLTKLYDYDAKISSFLYYDHKHIITLTTANEKLSKKFQILKIA